MMKYHPGLFEGHDIIQVLDGWRTMAEVLFATSAGTKIRTSGLMTPSAKIFELNPCLFLYVLQHTTSKDLETITCDQAIPVQGP